MSGKVQTIRDIINKKNEKVLTANAEFKDINRPLLKVLFGISVHGKAVYDEEVAEIIMGGYDTMKGDAKRALQGCYEAAKEKYGTDLRKRNGYIRDPENRIYLVPKV